MTTINNSEMVYVEPHGNDTEKFVTFWLRDLGLQFKVERTEDWEDCQREEKSYCEMIRVRNSRPVNRKGIDPLTGKSCRIYYMPSNLYKYSETELALYMKDHRSLWPKLAEIAEEEFNGFDPNEEEFIFPIKKFPEIAKLVEFRKKRRPSQAFIKARDRRNSILKSTCKGKMKGVNFRERESGSASTYLDHFEGGNYL